MRETTGESPAGIRCREVHIAGFTLRETTYAPGIRLSPHAHSRAKISLVMAGGTDETSLNEEHHCGAGSAVLKPAGADHSNVFAPKGMRAVSVYRHNSSEEEEQEWNRLLDRYRWIHGGPVVRALVSIYQALRQSTAGSAEETEECLYDLMALIQSEPRTADGNSSPPWLASVRDYLHAHSGEAVEVRRLAAMVNTHPVYLARVFRRRYDCTIAQYLHRLRTRRAMELLTASGTSLAGVALDCGFADQAHLCRVFKSQTGVTPGGYRLLALHS